MHFFIKGFDEATAQALVGDRIRRAQVFAHEYDQRAELGVLGYQKGQGIAVAKMMLYVWADAFYSGLHTAKVSSDDAAPFFPDTVLRRLDPDHNEEQFYPELRAWTRDLESKP